MRKSIMTAVLLSILVLLSALAGCDYGATDIATTQTTALQSDPGDPGAMVQAVLDASQNVTSLSCSFDVEVQLNLDPMTLLPEDEMFLGLLQGPVTLSGTLQGDDEAEAIKIDLTFGMAGITYNMGVRALSDQAWMSMFGQWYDLSSAIDEYGEEVTSSGEFDIEAAKSAMADLGVDPVDWLGDIELVGEETLDGILVFHLACEPDVSLIIDDVLVLLEDDSFMLALDSSGDLLDSLEDDFLSDADLRDMRAELPQMLEDWTLDLWVSEDDSLLRRVETSLRLGPPPGDPTEGLESIDLVAQVSFDDFDLPVEVEAPENALPFSSFMEMFGSDFPLPFEGLEDFLDEPTKS